MKILSECSLQLIFNVISIYLEDSTTPLIQNFQIKTLLLLEVKSKCCNLTLIYKVRSHHNIFYKIYEMQRMIT